MKALFKNCSSLSSIPNITKWNIKGIINIEEIFMNCSSLSSLPDISKWKIESKEVNNIFEGCLSLSSFPDIFKWYLGDNKKIFGNSNNYIYLLNE